MYLHKAVGSSVAGAAMTAPLFKVSDTNLLLLAPTTSLPIVDRTESVALYSMARGRTCRFYITTYAMPPNYMCSSQATPLFFLLPMRLIRVC